MTTSKPNIICQYDRKNKIKITRLLH